MAGITMLARRWKGSGGCAIWSSWRSRSRIGCRVVGVGVVAGGFIDALASTQRTRVSTGG